MSGIKYYRLRNDEEPPDEFCAVRHVNDEPSEYMWYERTGEVKRDLLAENAKLRELCGQMLAYLLPNDRRYTLKERMSIVDGFEDWCRELGIEVEA